MQFEIAANGSLPDGWTWKLSTADITEDVPFSEFPGVNRQFCVADGNGVELTIDERPHQCLPASITPFLGDARVHARLLDGPMRALNLMTRHEDTGRLRVLDEGGRIRGALAAVAIGGHCEVAVDGETVALQVLDALIDLAEEEVRVRRGQLAILIRD